MSDVGDFLIGVFSALIVIAALGLAIFGFTAVLVTANVAWILLVVPLCAIIALSSVY